MQYEIQKCEQADIERSPQLHLLSSDIQFITTEKAPATTYWCVCAELF